MINRGTSQITLAALFTMAPGMDRVSLGGAPWGDAATKGGALCVGTYQRLALDASRLLDTQVAAPGDTGSSLAASAVVHDSGFVATETDPAWQRNVLRLRASAATGRYLLVEVVSLGAAEIDIGRLVAGQLWRISRAMAYGVQEEREVRDRNPLTRAEFQVPALVHPRVARFTLPLLSAAEVPTRHRALVAALGGVGEALWIAETSLTAAELNARCIWGAVAAIGVVLEARKLATPDDPRLVEIPIRSVIEMSD